MSHRKDVMSTWRGETGRLAFVQAAYKLTTETAEFAEPFGKRLFKPGFIAARDKELEELGDVSYYLVLITALYGDMPLSGVHTIMSKSSIEIALLLTTQLMATSSEIAKLTLESEVGHIVNRARIKNLIVEFQVLFGLLLSSVGTSFEEVRALNYAKLSGSPDNNGWSKTSLFSFSDVAENYEGGSYFISANMAEMIRSVSTVVLESNNDVPAWLRSHGLQYNFDTESDCATVMFDSIRDAFNFVLDFNALVSRLGNMTQSAPDSGEVVEALGVLYASMRAGKTHFDENALMKVMNSYVD